MNVLLIFFGFMAIWIGVAGIFKDRAPETKCDGIYQDNWVDPCSKLTGCCYGVRDGKLMVIDLSNGNVVAEAEDYEELVNGQALRKKTEGKE